MDDQLLNLIGQYGIGGLFFVMWWFERRDRMTAESKVDRMATVVEANSSVIAEFREELRFFRSAFMESRGQ